MAEEKELKKEHKVWELFATFFKIGAFTFGGGYAMIPMIQKAVVDDRHWISEQDILDVIAIAETTPGPIAINSATFVGYKVAGVKGAIAATLGVVLPSFIIITLIAMLFGAIKDNKIVKSAFKGIRLGVLALIVKACISMYKKNQKDIFGYVIMGAAFVAVAVLKVNVFIVVLSAAAAGLIYSEIKRRAKA